jgi:hypothetical protein
MTFPPSSYGYFTMVNLTKYFIIIIINYWGNGNFKEKNRKCPATKRGKIMSDQIATHKLCLNSWPAWNSRLIFLSPGGHYKQEFAITIFFYWTEN